MQRIKTNDYYKYLFVFVGTILFLLPLVNAWMFYPLSYVNLNTSTAALGGVIPWSDASGYFNGANTFLLDGTLDSFQTRRPLNAILYSLRLWLTDYNFKFSLIIQALFCGFCCLLVSSRISQTFGKTSSYVTLTLLFFFASAFIPTTLTETLGLTLGCLGFMLLWDGVSRNNLNLIFTSGIILTVGLNSRAGPFLMLPLIILWLGLKFNRTSEKFSFNWQASSVMTFGIMIGFAFSWVLSLHTNIQDGATHSNFAVVLYGLVSGGKSWAYAYKVFPELAHLSEADGAKFLYAKSYELFKENPFLLLLGFSRGIAGLIKCLVSFFQYDFYHPVLKIIVRALGFIALFFGMKRFKNLYQQYPTELGLLGVAVLGMVLSAFVIWTDGGFRVFAVGVPFAAVTVGIIFGSFFSPFPNKPFAPINPEKSNFETKATILLSTCILLSGLLWPLFVKMEVKKHPILLQDQKVSCAPHETPIISYKVAGSPHINLTYPATRFRKNVLQSALEYKKSFTRILEPDILNKSMTLALIYNLNTHLPQYILGPTELFTQKNDLVGICASEIQDVQYIKKVQSYEVLNGK